MSAGAAPAGRRRLPWLVAGAVVLVVLVVVAARLPGLGRTGLAPGLGASDFGSICGLSAAALASAPGDPGGGSFFRM